MRRLVLLLALVAAPACAAPVTERAQSLVRQDRNDEAIALLRARLASHPDDMAARRLLVRVLGFIGDVADARTEVSELARRLGPGDPVPLIELGHAFELSHHYDEALAAYDDAAAAAPSLPDGPREGGLRCAHWGELGDARPRLEEAIRRGARDADTFHALGLVRVHLGDYDGAAEAYRAGIAADPSRVDSWIGLATVALARDDAAGALDAYDAIVARHPSFATAYLGRAWALGRLGRTADARKALDTAEQLGAPRESIARQRAALERVP